MGNFILITIKLDIEKDITGGYMHKAAGSGVSMTFDQTQISKIKVIFHIVTKADGSPDSKDFILNWCF